MYSSQVTGGHPSARPLPPHRCPRSLPRRCHCHACHRQRQGHCHACRRQTTSYWQTFPVHALTFFPRSRRHSDGQQTDAGQRSSAGNDDAGTEVGRGDRSDPAAFPPEPSPQHRPILIKPMVNLESKPRIARIILRRISYCSVRCLADVFLEGPQRVL